MKKVSILLASMAVLAFISCGEKKEKETIIIEKQVETPKESDGTSLNIGDGGIEFSTKNGNKKTEVKIE